MNLTSIRPSNNRVLVLLPAQGEIRHESGLLLAPSLTPPATVGRVLKVGPAVREVREGDVVTFPPEVGDPIALTDHHEALFVREPEIAAILSKRGTPDEAP